MPPPDPVKFGKFLSLVLRHKPEAAGVSLDEEGWCSIDALLPGLRRAGFDVGRVDLETAVRDNAKKRFAISPDGARIRAQQGHSVAVDLGLTPISPPQVLYHGTVDRVLEAIRREGLRTMRRRHVHLSADIDSALAVGGRRGSPVILVIRAIDMHAAGHVFFRSGNGVWLTDHVPPAFIRFPER